VLERGMALIEPVLVRRPGWADARALRGALLLALAGDAGDAGGAEARARARRALADLRAAADANRNLAPVLREPLRQAEQLGGPG
jgi:hypothetical protein